MEYFILAVVMCMMLMMIWHELDTKGLKKRVEKLESRCYSTTSTEEAAQAK